MQTIKHFDLRRLDLNLLITFDALMMERSVTAAAKRLSLGQPAVSHSLGRLRELLGDRLFVPSRRGLMPTSRASQLAPRIHALLECAQQTLLESREFDPGAWSGVVRIGLPDRIEMVLLPKILAGLHNAAPEARIIVRSASDWREALNDLETEILDLYIGFGVTSKPSHRHQTLWHEGFLALFSPDQINLRSPLTLDDFVAYPHVMATPRQGSLTGRTDEALARVGRKRHVVVSTPHVLAVPHLLLSGPFICVLHARPARLLASAFGLIASPVPLDIGTVPEGLVWHAVTDNDPAHVWLRQMIAAVATAV